MFDILGSWKYKAILDYYGTNHRDYATQCTNSPSKTDGINQPGLRRRDTNHRDYGRSHKEETYGSCCSFKKLVHIPSLLKFFGRSPCLWLGLFQIFQKK